MIVPLHITFNGKLGHCKQVGIREMFNVFTCFDDIVTDAFLLH